MDSIDPFKDPFLYGALDALRSRINALETEVRELRSLVTPLDPGSLPPNANTPESPDGSTPAGSPDGR